MKKTLVASIIASMLLPHGQAYAWNAEGHQTVGAIADQLLQGSKAGARVKAILGDTNLEKISVWADCAKGIAPEKEFNYTVVGRYAECAPFETAAGIAEMADFVKRNNTQCNPASGEETCHKQYHYTNIDHHHQHYHLGPVGTSDHDIVHAIKAAVLYLQGQPTPAPFSFKNEREALATLTHYLGDLHQPLHVGSVYLDQDGKLVHPEPGTYDKATHTVGGNALQCPCGNLHSLWDDVPYYLKRGKQIEGLVAKAKGVTKTSGAIASWSEQWASATMAQSRLAFAKAEYSSASPAGQGRGSNWSIGLPLAYEKTMNSVKEDGLVKGGAHLAELLQAIWPD